MLPHDHGLRRSPSPHRADKLPHGASFPSDKVDATDAVSRQAAQQAPQPPSPATTKAPTPVVAAAVPSYVKLKAGKGSPGALEVLNRDGVFQVLPTSPKTTLHLANVKTGKRIGPGTQLTKLRLPRSWFEAASAPTDDAVAEAAATPIQQSGDRFELRALGWDLPDTQLIWDANGGIDRYTRQTQAHFTAQGPAVKVHKDHVIEIQTATRIMEAAFPDATANGGGGPAVDPRVITVRDRVLYDHLNGTVGGKRVRRNLQRSPVVLAGFANLNNTEALLNMNWKGVAVSRWHAAFGKAGGELPRLRRLLDNGDGSFAGCLRDVMKEATAKEAGWATRGAKNATIVDRYQPRWARHVDEAMAKSVAALLEKLGESDGELVFARAADQTRAMAKAMKLAGFDD